MENLSKEILFNEVYKNKYIFVKSCSGKADVSDIEYLTKAMAYKACIDIIEKYNLEEEFNEYCRKRKVNHGNTIREEKMKRSHPAAYCADRTCFRGCFLSEEEY